MTRLELMRTLGRGEAMRDALNAEALGMYPEEFAIVATRADRSLAAFRVRRPGRGRRAVCRGAQARAGVSRRHRDHVSKPDRSRQHALLERRQPAGQLETPAPDCDPDTIRIAGLDAARAAGMLRLIRLQRRLGWSFTVLDRVLIALQAPDLDAALLEKITIAQELAARLDRPVTELLVLWAPIDTFGKDNEFDRLFTTRAVTWRTQDEKTFQLRPDRTELAETGPSLDAVSSALLAAFRITSEELALIRAMQTRRGAEPRLDLAGLSSIYRVVVLARTLQLRIPAFDLLLRLIPPEADPFRAADPEATRRFVEMVQEVQASDFTPERLAYLFRHESEPRRDPGPLPAQVDAVLANIRRGLADAFSETSHPAEVTGDVLRQKLATLVDPALLDPAIEVLDPRTPLAEGKRREFFDRHLSKIFADPAAAANRLFGGSTAEPSPPAPPAPAPPAPAPPEPTPSTPPVTTAATPESSPTPAPPPAPAHRRRRSRSGGKRIVISCSNTCCRSCEPASCAARWCKR